MPVRVLIAATGEPVSVDDVRTHLRIESTEEDYLLLSYITAARLYAENYCRRSFMPQTFRLSIDTFPASGLIELPFAPLSTNSTDVTITYADSSGNSTTLSSTYYTVDYQSEPGRIILNKDLDWPDTYGHYLDVSITYKSGYPLDANSTGGTCPGAIKQWILMRVGQMYEHREPVLVGQNFSYLQRSFVGGLLDPYVLPEIV